MVSLPVGTGIPWRLISRAAPKHSVMLWLGDFAPRPEPEGWTAEYPGTYRWYWAKPGR